MTEISNVPFCSFVHVEPASVDDWEILVSILMCVSYKLILCNSIIFVVDNQYV